MKTHEPAPPLSEGNYETKIIKWLEQQGYPLEMLVAQSFQKADFEVSQSDFFIDPESGEPREIDVIAYDFADYNFEKLWIQVSCCIECKSSRMGPWIVFRPYTLQSSAILGKSMGFSLPSINSKLGDELLQKAISQPDIQSLAMLNLKPIGYAVAQALLDKNKGPDVPYEALSKVSKAAIALADKSEKEARAASTNHCHIIFPVIVIDVDLFECWLDDTGQIAIAAIESSAVLWQKPSPGYPLSVVSIFTKRSLGKLVSHFREATDALLKRGELLA